MVKKIQLYNKAYIKMSYIKDSINIIKESFKKFKFIILIYNILWLISSYLIIFICFYLLKLQYERLSIKDLSLVTENILSYLITIKNILILLIFIAILFILLMLLNSSIFIPLIYCTLLNKKLNLSIIARFTLLNTLWFISWSLLYGFFFITIKIKYIPILTFIFILAFLHFSNILYTKFVKTKRFSLKLLKFSFSILTKLTPHYFIALIVLILITNLARFLPQKLFIITLTAYISWLEHYMIYAVARFCKK